MGLLVRLLFFGLILFVILRVVRGGRGYRRGFYDGFTGTPRGPFEHTPDEILRRRYAAGEISREQYEEMRRTLEPAT
ncbi:MAG: SHOCT domain-containing protein [Chloroflexi bacterium]|nr:SHOCT domain-containing protein [Chloroflexota bacterium]MBV9600545.1 SHOCT domain-containing protein [Chloroflexota bacterium]